MFTLEECQSYALVPLPEELVECCPRAIGRPLSASRAPGAPGMSFPIVIGPPATKGPDNSAPGGADETESRTVEGRSQESRELESDQPPRAAVSLSFILP